MKNYIGSTLAFFCFLFLITFEFDYSILPEFHEWINPFFERLVKFTGEAVFGIYTPFESEISSDSLGLYIHLFNLIWIALVLSVLVLFVRSQKKVNLRLSFLKILTYYLSLQLLIYGFDKLFKAQFFYPEPNILHTNLKDLSPDILYWSTMGLSRGYSMFLGGAEILAAIFLWWKKTKLIGLVLGTGIMVNVFAVNLGFDISVKVYSLFLLGCFLFVLSPYFYYLHAVFILKHPIEIPSETSTDFGFLTPYKKWIKSAVICLILVEGLFPYFMTRNWNDDSAKRPIFHGAYLVESNPFGIQKLYIHREGYLIFENEYQQKEDFQLEVDTLGNQFILWDYRNKNELRCRYKSNNNNLKSLQFWSDSTQEFTCVLIE